MELDPQADILRRLRCTAGHLNAVIEMAESGQPCERVLHQLNAVQSALHATGTKIICCENESIQDVILNSDSFDQRSTELKRLQSLYAIYLQDFNHTQEVTHD